MGDKKTKKPIYKRWWFWVAAVIVLIIIIASAGGNTSNPTPTDGETPSPTTRLLPGVVTPSVSPSASASPEAKNTVDMQLSSGNYTAGMDFPAGKYQITAVSGSGNVSSANLYSGGINAMMGTAEANKAAGADLYEQLYSNIELPNGVVLSVSGGVVIKITSDNADTAPLKQRVQANTQPVNLGNGNFVAGTDFPAGTYDIMAVSGGGNVSTDNMYSGGINAIMGPKEANTDAGSALYEQEYKNIELPQGTTISIDGVKIQLVPSI